MSMVAPLPSEDTPTWLRVLLGIVLIIAGLIVLGNIAMATVVGTMLIGIVAIAGGVFEIIHAFWTKGWGGFIWQIILGVLYVIAGIYLLTRPVGGALALTWLIAVVFLALGVVRLIAGFQIWKAGGWLLVLSGVFGIVAGIIILAGWPESSIWVIGLLLGIDLVFAGVGWLMCAWAPKAA
ncbi:MAG TPA: HdeD family acid-resistance protein [Bauldia sp.]|nr:HdeD family acid-resistance protein [Bauldia sp.]